MLNGLDLFSGIGGISSALAGVVRVVAYCENNAYAQRVLLSRMASGQLDVAPIWDDVKTLTGSMFGPYRIHFISAGFPCQDISVAGRGDGLSGTRSGLFFEIARLADELRPSFIFLENVPAITNRGGLQVVEEFTQRGYRCAWTCVSAQAVRAPHKRERWFMLASLCDLGHAQHDGLTTSTERGGDGSPVSNSETRQEAPCQLAGADTRENGVQQAFQHSLEVRLQGHWPSGEQELRKAFKNSSCSTDEAEPVWDSESIGVQGHRPGGEQEPHPFFGKRIPLRPSKTADWWGVEPPVGRVVNGLPHRVDRIKCLGNSVVPAQVRLAFEFLVQELKEA